jgi:hypothetical protein
MMSVDGMMKEIREERAECPGVVKAANITLIE